MDRIEIIVTIVAALVSGGGILSLFFRKHQLKLQQRANINERLTEKRIAAIEKIIEFEQKANVMEYQDFVHPELFGGDKRTLTNKGLNEHIVYMEIMEDRDKLASFVKELSNIRNNEEKWVSRKVAVFLLYAEKYILEFYSYLTTLNYREFDLYIFGIILAPDIQKWQRALDKTLIKELNEIPLTNEEHTGDDWEYRKEIMQEEYEKTILFKVVHNEEDEASALLAELIACYNIYIKKDILKPFNI